jgi:hypothetical protein
MIPPVIKIDEMSPLIKEKLLHENFLELRPEICGKILRKIEIYKKKQKKNRNLFKTASIERMKKQKRTLRFLRKILSFQLEYFSTFIATLDLSREECFENIPPLFDSFLGEFSNLITPKIAHYYSIYNRSTTISNLQNKYLIIISSILGKNQSLTKDFLRMLLAHQMAMHLAPKETFTTNALSRVQLLGLCCYLLANYQFSKPKLRYQAEVGIKAPKQKGYRIFSMQFFKSYFSFEKGRSYFKRLFSKFQANIYLLEILKIFSILYRLTLLLMKDALFLPKNIAGKKRNEQL